MNRPLASLLIALAAAPALATRFDSPENVALEATLADGKLLTSASDAATLQTEIRAQLKYLIGHLFSVGSPALGHSLSLQLRSTAPIADGRKEVRYAAKFLIAWEKTVGSPAAPAVLTVALPAGGDSSALRKFDGAYSGKCGESGSPLWYSMPNAKSASCPLSRPSAPAYAAKFSFALAPSPSNSQGKSPEYEKIWEDGKLVVTWVVGNSGSRGQAEELVERMKLAYGSPTDLQTTSHGSYSEVTAGFDTPAGPLRIQALDIVSGNIQQMGAEFRTKLARYSEESDLVAYNGHSDYGANLRKFTALASFLPKRYYLFWINACKPFAHLDDTLWRSARQANPGVPASKYLDVMSVVNIGEFSSGSDISQLIQGLVVKRDFRGLLTWLTTGGPAVLGDEDNYWPSPFQE